MCVHTTAPLTSGINSDAPGGLVVPDTLVSPAVMMYRLTIAITIFRYFKRERICAFNPSSLYKMVCSVCVISSLIIVHFHFKLFYEYEHHINI
jgi:hypothetical protein